MIIDAHYHLDERMETLGRLVAEMDIRTVKKVNAPSGLPGINA